MCLWGCPLSIQVGWGHLMDSRLEIMTKSALFKGSLKGTCHAKSTFGVKPCYNVKNLPGMVFYFSKTPFHHFAVLSNSIV